MKTKTQLRIIPIVLLFLFLAINDFPARNQLVDLDLNIYCYWLFNLNTNLYLNTSNQPHFHLCNNMFQQHNTTSCVFCKIAAGIPTGKGKLKPTRVLFRNEYFFILEDIQPATDHHYLAIPVRHIKNASCLQPGDEDLGKYKQTRL